MARTVGPAVSVLPAYNNNIKGLKKVANNLVRINMAKIRTTNANSRWNLHFIADLSRILVIVTILQRTIVHWTAHNDN